MDANLDIESKMNEAEVWRSMQLLDDSLRIYEEVLGGLEPHDTTTHAEVENRIRLLKQEISDLEGPKPGDLPHDEIDSIIGPISPAIPQVYLLNCR